MKLGSPTSTAILSIGERGQELITTKPYTAQTYNDYVREPVLEWKPVISGDALEPHQMNDLASAIKRLEGMVAPQRVLEKCIHCGQWGAVMCACPACGAPIDPKG